MIKDILGEASPLVSPIKSLGNFESFHFLLFCVYGCFCLHVYLCITCMPGARGGQKRV